MLVTAWQRYVHYFVFMVADAGFRGCGGVRVCGYLGPEKKMKMLVVGGMIVRTCLPLTFLEKRQRKRSCLSFYFFYCALEVCFCCALACLFIFSVVRWRYVSAALLPVFFLFLTLALCRYLSLIRSLYGYTYRRICVCVCVCYIYIHTDVFVCVSAIYTYTHICVCVCVSAIHIHTHT